MPSPLVMNFLDSTLRDWKVRLLPMADRKPFQLKVTYNSRRRGAVKGNVRQKCKNFTMNHYHGVCWGQASRPYCAQHGTTLLPHAWGSMWHSAMYPLNTFWVPPQTPPRHPLKNLPGSQGFFDASQAHLRHGRHAHASHDRQQGDEHGNGGLVSQEHCRQGHCAAVNPSKACVYECVGQGGKCLNVRPLTRCMQ
jgi:hypothetical protein